MAACAMFAMLGCDPLAPPSYRGELLGALKGEIVSDFSTQQPPPSAEVVLLFLNWKTDPGTVVGSRETTSGDFPSGFTMSLYAPPAPEGLNMLPRALDDLEEPQIGFAWIVVIRQGAAPPGRAVLTHADVKRLSTGDVLGWAEDHVVVYLDHKAAPGTFAAQILGAPLDAGFHLMRAGNQLVSADVAAQIRMCLELMPNGTGCSYLFPPLVPADGENGSRLIVHLTPDLFALRVPLFALPPKVEQAFGIGGG